MTLITRGECFRSRLSTAMASTLAATNPLRGFDQCSGSASCRVCHAPSTYITWDTRQTPTATIVKFYLFQTVRALTVGGGNGGRQVGWPIN